MKILRKGCPYTIARTLSFFVTAFAVVIAFGNSSFLGAHESVLRVQWDIAQLQERGPDCAAPALERRICRGG